MMFQKVFATFFFYFHFLCVNQRMSATMFLFRLGSGFWCRGLCDWGLSWCCDALDFIFRCNESVFLKNSVLLSDALWNLLCGLDAESLQRRRKILTEMHGHKTMVTYIKTKLVVVVQAGLDLSLGFQAADDVSVLPSNLVSDTADLAVLAIWTEAQDLHGQWDADALLFVIRRWNAFEDLQAVESDCSTAGLMWDHA